MDRAGDLFGYMFLTVPKSKVKAGEPLTLQVSGEDANSLDWYMTLQYNFRFFPLRRAEPALLNGGAGYKQLLRLSLDNLQEGRSIEVSATGAETIRQPLNIGANILYVPVPAVYSACDVPITTTINRALAGKSTLRVGQVNRREVYLLSYSHNDIGYTDIQPVIERRESMLQDHRTEKEPASSCWLCRTCEIRMFQSARNVRS